MIVIKNKLIPFEGYSTINLFGILFTKCETLSPQLLNHETIHTRQMQEMLYIFFYLWYIIEYLIKRFFNSSQKSAYKALSFEREAYANEDNLDYLKDRQPFSWIKYLI